MLLVEACHSITRTTALDKLIGWYSSASWTKDDLPLLNVPKLDKDYLLKSAIEQFMNLANHSQPVSSLFSNQRWLSIFIVIDQSPSNSKPDRL